MDEFRLVKPAGYNYYVLLRKFTGEVRDIVAAAWDSWLNADIDDYDIAMTDDGGGLYTANMPAGIDSGRYIAQYRRRVGASPAIDDPIQESELKVWNGSGEVFEIDPSWQPTLAQKILANKAVQDKTTGAVVYYDDDGVTPLLTHTPTDTDTEITRTPS